MTSLPIARVKYYAASEDGYLSILPTLIKKIVYTSTAAATTVVTISDIASTVIMKLRATLRKSITVDLTELGGLYVNGPYIDMAANSVCTIWYETISQTNSISVAATTFNMRSELNGYTITPVDTATITVPKKADVTTGWTVTLSPITGLSLTINADSGDGNSLYFSSAVSTYDISGTSSATITYNGTYFVITKA